MEILRYCSKCDSDKPQTEEFWHKRKSRKDGWEFYCKECVKKRTLENYNKNKEKWNATTRKNRLLQKDRINEYKDPLCCLKCGEDRNHLLDFHHKDPKKKEFQISQGEGFGWKRVLKEIKKCIVLCSNCHRDFHFLQKKDKITINKYLSK
jgi:hypothetical protein